MELVQIDIAEIAELATPVAMHGSMGAGEVVADGIFELIVGIVALVAEILP